MPSDFAFRFSTYLALALSCACLGFAEWDWLPEASAFAGVIIVTLVVSFLLEGRAELSLARANVLGLIIALVAILWLASQFAKPANSAIAQLSWPTSLLPYMGPVLMILIPAKLFRPKHTGDWWTMHGVGMAAVGLATSMDDQPFFAFLLALYAIAEVVALVLFFYRRTGGYLPPVPNQKMIYSPEVVVDELKSYTNLRRLVGNAMLWLLVAAVIALPAFLLTPRGSTQTWGMSHTRIEIGSNADSIVDLNHTGDLKSNEKIAFTVRASLNEGRPKTDLDAEQMWRSNSFQSYEDGKWKTERVWLRASRSLTPDSQRSLDSLMEDDTYFLDYTPEPDLKARPITSPVQWRPTSSVPVTTLRNMPGRNLPEIRWGANNDGSFLAPPEPRGLEPIQYRQVAYPVKEAMLSTGFERTAQLLDGSIRIASDVRLRAMAVPGIRDWSRALLNRLITEGKLPRTVRTDAEKYVVFQIDPKHWEVVARAFSNHLANSGKYQYSLKLSREDRKLDPIEDFLVNSKAGHCERFAAALALSLRALEIPTQFVLGFKGCEPIEDGLYVVRHSHAHAWVEVLVPRPVPENFPLNPMVPAPNEIWHWLTLDPTPGNGDAVGNGNANWFSSIRNYSYSIFNDFIVGYTPDRRESALQTVGTFLRKYWWIGLILFALPFLRKIHLHRKRKAQAAAAASTNWGNVPAWYLRLLEMLERYGFTQKPGSTPREYAEQTRGTLLAISHPEIADLPMFVVSKMYRVRFANHPLNAEEETAVDHALDRLETALRQLPPVKSRAKS